MQGNPASYKKVDNRPRTYEQSLSCSAVNHNNWRTRSNAKPLTVTRIKAK